jgi:hypothetical protein
MKKHISILVAIVVIQFIALGTMAVKYKETDRIKEDYSVQLDTVINQLERCGYMLYPNEEATDSLTLIYIEESITARDL